MCDNKQSWLFNWDINENIYDFSQKSQVNLSSECNKINDLRIFQNADFEGGQYPEG